MGRKGGKYKKKEDNYPSKRKTIHFNSDDDDMMNDDIDAFHKQRDIVPLDMNGDMEESDEDAEIPVLDFEQDKDDDEDDGDGDGDDDIDDDDAKPTGLAAKIVRTQKYLRAKFGGVEDELLDDAEEEEKTAVWGRKKDMYGADVDYEPQSSDDEDAVDEEKEVLKLQSERAKSLTMEDFGLEDYSQDESDMEPTFEEILDKGKPKSKASLDKEINDDADYEIVKKDLNALTKEEQMDVVYSSAPELVGLLSELNDALEQLEKKINPLVHKIREQENAARKGEMHYIEVKQLLLQCYCQAITFYLLLKAEGLPVRDHPVVSRLVEIKNLLDKMKELDENLPFDLEDIVSKIASAETVTKVVGNTAVPESDPFTKGQVSLASPEKHATDESKEAPALVEVNISRSSKSSESRHKNQDNEVGEQSIEMLKLRAALEEKLKQKGVFSSIAPKDDRVRKNLSPMNRQLETLDDFDDEAMEMDGVACGKSNGEAGLSQPSKLSQLLALQRNKQKAISGDDDIPKRDDIGERRRKHELRVLAGAGVKSVDDDEDEPGALSSDEGSDVPMESDADSDLEYYKQVERQHAAKADKYSRVPELPSFPEETADGKRHITYQMEKNRGLTRARKKLTKNPRKKYKLKHKKAEVRRKGQVREIRKPKGPYGGEASGINAGISRSIRFKN